MQQKIEEQTTKIEELETTIQTNAAGAANAEV